jgi:hypothetical protein
MAVMSVPAATLTTMAIRAATTIGTIALADQLNHLRERVPLTESDIARATGAEPSRVRAWLAREEPPAGGDANRLTELMAVVEEMACTFRPESVSGWLNCEVPALDGGVPADVIAAGGYERLSAGAFT